MRNFHEAKIAHYQAIKSADRKLDDISMALSRIGMDKLAEEIDDISANLLMSYKHMDQEFGQHLNDEHDKALAGVGSILSALVNKSEGSVQS